MPSEQMSTFAKALLIGGLSMFVVGALIAYGIVWGEANKLKKLVDDSHGKHASAPVGHALIPAFLAVIGLIAVVTVLVFEIVHRD